jgi:polyphosphate glucokinase
MSWKRSAAEFNEYLAMLDRFFWPDTIILGGGLSKESKKYEKYLVSRAELVNARFLNTSGIIGAAYAAALAASEAADASPSAGGARKKAAAGTVGSKKRG